MLETTLVEPSGEDRNAAGLCVLVMSPNGFETHALPASGHLVIGRSSEVDIPISDPRASRRHALLHIGERVMIEDLNSRNGTRVRGVPIPPATRIAVEPGEAIVIGGTCLMVDREESPAAQTGVWSHSTFEARAQELCERARLEGLSFGVGRIRAAESVYWTEIVPVLARTIRHPHLIAAYGAAEYELLFRDVSHADASAILEKAVARLALAGHEVRAGLAWFPRDGRSVDALIEHSCARVRALEPELRAGGLADSGGLAESAEPAMRRLYELATRVAAGTINVLIQGETGVGKEVLAQAIHRLSPRRDGHLLCLNCAGLSDTALLESELFGYEKGAFTGATQSKMGLLETADGGTVFLDELGELPLVTQAKLLRVIDRREVTRVGGLKARPIDVRFVSATNHDLETDCDRNAFRKDLLFRLNGICLEIPPLRERRLDLAALCQTFLAGAASNLGRKKVPTLSARATRVLSDYSWPGNIRELRNVIDRAVALCSDLVIDLEHLPLEKMKVSSSRTDRARAAETTGPVISDLHAHPGLPTLPPPTLVASEERRRIVDALSASAGNQSRAAASLGIPRRTFVSKLQTYGIPRPQKS